MGFQDEVQDAAKDMDRGNDWYKFVEGDNKMLILSEPVIQVSRFGYGICYEGAPYCQKKTLDKELEEAKEKAVAAGQDPKKVSIRMPGKKWCAWAIVRGKEGAEDVMKIVGLPYKVSKTLLDLMTSDEAGFKAFPMPYEINIKATGAGTLNAEYQVLPSRANTDMTEGELEDYGKLTPVSQILDRMKDKQRQKVEGTSASSEPSRPIEYPEEDINPDDIPF